MRFLKGIELPTYIYSDDDLKLKEVGALDKDKLVSYDDPIETRWFYAVDTTYGWKDDERISCIHVGETDCFIKMPIKELNEKLELHGYTFGK